MKTGKSYCCIVRALASILLIASSLISCNGVFGFGPTEQELQMVDYAPLEGQDWTVSTPGDEGLDPLDVARLYYDAAQLETIYSLLVIRNGQLIAEDYWNGSGSWQTYNLTSVTKSYTGALTGLAIEQGYIDSVDQPMMDFFPEFADQITDPRKFDITVMHLLQMRAGYPADEASPELSHALWVVGLKASNLVDFPLIRDPGTGHDYSSLSSLLLGIIVTRATDTDLLEYGGQNLFSLIDSEAGAWPNTHGYYRPGYSLLEFNARDTAKFGQLYLDGGVFSGTQVVPEDWVTKSLETQSEEAFDYRIGPNVREMGYGYQWWSLQSGNHHCNMAWGHGGQLIMLVHDLDMVIVLTADPFLGQSDGESWSNERANINLVADFIASLPAE